MIIGEIEKVTKTNIFVAKLGPKTQLTVYANSIDTINPVAMILPIPCKSDTIQVIDISSEEDFFSKLSYACKELNYSTNKSLSLNSTTQGLEVKRCGSYQYSIVPDIKSLDRVNFETFGKLPNDFINKFYGGELKWSFIVCIIDKSAEYSPFCYTHKSNGKYLFVPTRHYHSHGNSHGQIYQEQAIDQDKYASDWDHSIYSIDHFLDDVFLTDEKNIANSFTMKAKGKTSIPHFSHELLQNLNWNFLKKRELFGYQKNGDIFLQA